MERVLGYYPTPAIAAEFITSFVGEARLENGEGLHGLDTEHEDIRAFVVPRAEAQAALGLGRDQQRAARPVAALARAERRAAAAGSGRVDGPRRAGYTSGDGLEREGAHMRVARDMPDAVGRTPLIRLRKASELTGCEILGKAEFLNPGQSVKDRAALYIIRDAVERGALRPGGTIVEGTAGNTGIGLALIGAAMGFRTVIVIPRPRARRRRTCSGSPAPSSSRCRRCPIATRTTT
jgi:hypothetical protein